MPKSGSKCDTGWSFEAWLWHVWHLADDHRYIKDCIVCNVHSSGVTNHTGAEDVKKDCTWYEKAKHSGKRVVKYGEFE